MTIRHHPADDLLLAHASGRLPTALTLVVGAHLETCARCRSTVRDLEALGGLLLDDLPPAPLPDAALARTLAAIDAPPAPRPPRALQAPPPLPPGAAWPRVLAGCAPTRWRWIGPGMHYARVAVPYDPAANLFLLRIAAGKYLPQHTHGGVEFTQVLHGRFHDGRALFDAGDFDAADGQVRHQPVVQEGGECICLAALDGRVLFDGFVARRLGALVGM